MMEDNIKRIIQFDTELIKCFESRVISYITEIGRLFQGNIDKEILKFRISNINLYNLERLYKFIKDSQFLINKELTASETENYMILLEYLYSIPVDTCYKQQEKAKFKDLAMLTVLAVNNVIAFNE